MDAEAIKPRVSATRRVVIFALALIPVSLIVAGFLLAVHAVRVITALYSQPTTQTAAPEQPAPEPPQPGVVILVPDSSIATEQPAKPAAPKQ